MSDKKPRISEEQLRQRVLSRWENEGGATPSDAQDDHTAGEARSEVHQLTNAELVQLRIRVISLENLIIALLAEASDRHLDLIREMAAYISPRAGFTHHPLTIQGAIQMVNLVERAGHFRVQEPE